MGDDERPILCRKTKVLDYLCHPPPRTTQLKDWATRRLMLAEATKSGRISTGSYYLDLAVTDRGAAAQRGRRLEYFTIAWNTLEGLLSVIAGALASSIALVGFGIDSFIEVTSAGALLWRMSVDQDAERRERNERIALRIVGLCFIGLAIYVAIDSAKTLFGHQAPERSIFGISIALASLVAMPLLARAKRRVAASMNSAAMRADSRQTDFCMYLSAILLAGLVFNWLFGWWWADPVAALIMTPIIAKEGVEGLKGHRCEDCSAPSTNTGNSGQTA